MSSLGKELSMGRLEGKVAIVTGGGYPIMETIALNQGYDYESKKNIAKYLAGINNELDQSKDVKQEPSRLVSK
jgi:hypothetical protein